MRYLIFSCNQQEKEAELDMVLKEFDNVEERIVGKIMEPLTDKVNEEIGCDPVVKNVSM